MTECLIFSELHDEITSKAHNVMSSVLENKSYNPAKVPEWIDGINMNCVDYLRKASPNFKYIVNCFIQQKVGAGLHFDTITHWDSKHDGAVTSKFENESLICVIVIFGLSL